MINIRNDLKNYQIILHFSMLKEIPQYLKKLVLQLLAQGFHQIKGWPGEQN